MALLYQALFIHVRFVIRGDCHNRWEEVVNGFDCLQPLEAKANMDVRQLSSQYGNYA